MTHFDALLCYAYTLHYGQNFIVNHEIMSKKTLNMLHYLKVCFKASKCIMEASFIKLR